MSAGLLSVEEEGAGGSLYLLVREMGLGYWASEVGGHWRPGLLGLCLGGAGDLDSWALGNIPGSWGEEGAGDLDFLVSRLERSVGKSDIGELKFLPFPHVNSFFRSQFSFIHHLK